jgi:hypothetical protein
MAIALSDNIYINSGKPSEAKSLRSDYTPYASVTEANNTIPLSFRYRGLTVVINDGSGDKKYWYKDGVANGNLVEFSAGTSFTFENALTESGGIVRLEGPLTKDTIISAGNFGFTIDFTDGQLRLPDNSTPLLGGAFTYNNGGGLYVEQHDGTYNVTKLQGGSGNGQIGLRNGLMFYNKGVGQRMFFDMTLAGPARTQTFQDADGIIQLQGYLGTKELTNAALSPTLTENGKFLVWDNTAGKYDLASVSMPTFTNGLTNVSGVVEFGGTNALTKNTTLNSNGTFTLSLGGNTTGTRLGTFIARAKTNASFSITDTGVSGNLGIDTTNGINGILFKNGYTSTFSFNDSEFQVTRTHSSNGLDVQFGEFGFASQKVDALATTYSTEMQSFVELDGGDTGNYVRSYLGIVSNGFGFQFDDSVDADYIYTKSGLLRYDTNAIAKENTITLDDNYIPSFRSVKSLLNGYAKLDGSNMPFTGDVRISKSQTVTTNRHLYVEDLAGTGARVAFESKLLGSNAEVSIGANGADSRLRFWNGVGTSELFNITSNNTETNLNVLGTRTLRLWGQGHGGTYGNIVALFNGQPVTVVAQQGFRVWSDDLSSNVLNFSTTTGLLQLTSTGQIGLNTNKAMVVGDSTTTTAGAIRYNTNKHQFYNGTAWHYSFGIGQKELDTTALNPTLSDDGKVYYYDNTTGKVGLKTVSGGSSAGSISNYPITMSSTGVALSGTCYASLVVADKTVTITSINTFVKSLSASTVYLGIYSADGNTLLASASASTNAVGFASGACSSVTLTAGVSYWFAVLEGVGACTFAQTTAASDAAISKSKFVSGSPSGMPANLSGFTGSSYNIYCAAKS